MKISPATSASSPTDSPLVEVLDQNSQVLAAMPLVEVRRQQLRHRSIVVLLSDEAGRLFLRKPPGARGQGPERWDAPVRSPVYCGESLQDAVTRAVEATLGIHVERMRLTQVLAPSLENGNELLHVFTLTRPEGNALQERQDESNGYFFGAEELECLLRDFSELISARFLLLAKTLNLTKQERTPL
jgi:isopentenyl-diphosphate delta-isomerase